jgi:hypothetical protein
VLVCSRRRRPRAPARPWRLQAGWRWIRLGPGRIKRVCQSRSPPKFERDRQGIDADPGPPRGFIAVIVQIPMVQPADRDCVSIAHLSAESTGLSKPNVMGLGWRAAAHNARLGRDELSVLLVAQANGFRRNATAPGASVIQGNCRRDCDCILNRSNKWLLDLRFRILCRRRMQLLRTSRRRHLDRCNPASTASAVINMFLAARFLWTQSAASSADWS